MGERNYNAMRSKLLDLAAKNPKSSEAAEEVPQSVRGLHTYSTPSSSSSTYKNGSSTGTSFNLSLSTPLANSESDSHTKIKGRIAGKDLSVQSLSESSLWNLALHKTNMMKHKQKLQF